MLWEPTSGSIAIFHEHWCCTKQGGIILNLTLSRHRGCIADVSKYHNTSMGHGFKDITLYVQRHILSKTNCHNPMLVRDLPPGVPSWSETRPLAYFICHRAILSSSVNLEMCCWLQHREFNNFSKHTASDNHLGWGKSPSQPVSGRTPDIHTGCPVPTGVWRSWLRE